MVNKIIHKGKAYTMSHERGFTLIEILATFVLIALIIPAAMEGISLATRLGVKSKQEVKAGTLAETELGEFLLNGDWSNGDQSGQFEGDDSAFKWSLKVTDWTQETSMKQLSMTVGWTDTAGMDHSVALSTLVYPESTSE